jgi:putative membrane protein insertion efficiency factor
VRILREIGLVPVRLYRLVISPLLGPRCRYYPSCSEYAVDAVRSYGVLRGAVLSGWRLLRCNPLSDGGIDPVENQRIFRARPAR